MTACSKPGILPLELTSVCSVRGSREAEGAARSKTGRRMKERVGGGRRGKGGRFVQCSHPFTFFVHIIYEHVSTAIHRAHHSRHGTFKRKRKAFLYENKKIKNSFISHGDCISSIPSTNTPTPLSHVGCTDTENRQNWHTDTSEPTVA